MGHHHEQRVPRGAILGAAALMVSTIAIAALARSSDPPATETPNLRTVDMRFEDRPDGSVAILDANTAEEIALLAPESNGFIRGVLRGMFRTRKLESIPRDDPFRLAEKTDGQLVLYDPSSGHEVELRSFGHTNYEAFASLLPASSP